ncbi:alpha-amylase family glycosyl hydrolase [Teichococcus coralli]|uniref:alpha-amylase family glycosyl hydrolase n=1 Tax=Teichococcus coralli TaxID=2545983 RepID=UPI001927BBFC|nr:alpha-amylase family glycosyl hydrolase [Pseudoroseomonas coralli]
MRELESELGRLATLDDIPDAEFDLWARQGFDWIYALGAWSTGEAGRAISRTRPEWRHAFEGLLPDLQERDICGSGFAITAYVVPPAIGGDAALLRMRRRLHARGLRLMLDFVPNHTALDHPWVAERPELFLRGSETLLGREPENYRRVSTARGTMVLAHGRDLYFPAWPDTLQLDHGNFATQEAMRGELLTAAALCDGLRCDMAMLVLSEIFERSWGRAAAPFWPGAICAVRERNPGFVFRAEVYWGLEAVMLQQGFDYSYDKTLYDRLLAGDAHGVHDHLRADATWQSHLVRFLENHDMPRVAEIMSWDAHQAAAVVTFASPGLRFFHQGQLEGRRKAVPIHLDRRPAEASDPVIAAFYGQLLAVLRRPALRDGTWRLLEPAPAWEGNPTHDGFIAGLWTGPSGERLLVAVNLQSHQGQCRITLPLPDLAGRPVEVADLLGPARYRHTGDELVGHGLYLDLAAYGYHLFAIEVAP